MPWQSPGGAFSRFSSISRAPGPSPCAPTQAGTPRPRPGDPRGPPARWRRLVDTPWELQGAFEFFRSTSSRRVGLSPRAGQGVPADPTAPASLQARPGTPRDPRGTSGPDFEFFRSASSQRAGLSPRAGQGVPADPTLATRPRPASRPARGPPGTPGEPPAPTLSFSLYKLAARRRPVRASSRPSEPSLAAGRAGGGPRGPQPPARPRSARGPPPGDHQAHREAPWART